ncbi:hypothetical protein ACLB2K_032681 [Fragaria x ananassa]
MWRCGRCVASQSALGWGDSLLNVAGRCPGESVHAWLWTVAMWLVSARLIGDCRYVALRPLSGDARLIGKSVRAWLGRLAIERCGPLRGESVRAWLGRLAIECCGPLPWRVSPRLIGDCPYVVSQCALDWRLSLCGVAAAEWRVSPRLVGDSLLSVAGRCVASQSALDWRLSLCGKECREELARRDQGSPRGLTRTAESARTGEVSRVRKDWRGQRSPRGLARLAESARTGEVSGVREDWLDQRSPLGGPRQCESAKGWQDLRSPRMDGGTCGVREGLATMHVPGGGCRGWGRETKSVSLLRLREVGCPDQFFLSAAHRRVGLGRRLGRPHWIHWKTVSMLAGKSDFGKRFATGPSLFGESVSAWLGTVVMWRVSARLIGDCCYVALRPLRGESVRAWLGRLAIERCGPLPWRVSPRLVGDCRYVASQCALDWRLSLCGVAAAEWRVSPHLVGDSLLSVTGRCVASQSALGWGDSLLSIAGRCMASQSALDWRLSLCGVAAAAWRVSPRLSVRAWLERLAIERCGPLRGESVRAWLGRLAIECCGPLPWRVSQRLIGDCRYVVSQCALDWRLSLCGVAAAEWRVSPRLVGDSLLSVAGRCVASQSALD